MATMRPLSVGLLVAGGLLLAAPVVAQTRYTPGPVYLNEAAPSAVPQRATPRSPYQATPEVNQNEINPYFRKNDGQGQASQESPLYRPYQPNATDAQKAQADPFRAPAPLQGTGSKSAYQQKTESLPPPRECTAFNRIGDTYADCKAAQSKQTFQNQQLKAQQQRQAR